MLLKTTLSWLDVGPAYYEDPVSSNPTYTKSRRSPLLGWSYDSIDDSISMNLERVQLVRRSALPFSLY